VTVFDVERHRFAYGMDDDQWGELYLPRTVRLTGVVVVIHGGYWRSAYTAALGAPLAQDLAHHGMVAWNLEYRRADSGGGWPATFEDISDGIDKLAELADLDIGYPLNLSRVVGLGHSAGGQLAVWAAARTKFPAGSPGARPKVKLLAVVSQSGVLDLAAAVALNRSHGAG
jgi:acetyl esterase/lipase